MMMILRDDAVLEVFDTPSKPPDIGNALARIDKAKMIEPNGKFPNLETLKEQTIRKSRLPRVPLGT